MFNSTAALPFRVPDTCSKTNAIVTSGSRPTCAICIYPCTCALFIHMQSRCKRNGSEMQNYRGRRTDGTGRVDGTGRRDRTGASIRKQKKKHNNNKTLAPGAISPPPTYGNYCECAMAPCFFSLHAGPRTRVLDGDALLCYVVDSFFLNRLFCLPRRPLGHVRALRTQTPLHPPGRFVYCRWRSPLP